MINYNKIFQNIGKQWHWYSIKYAVYIKIKSNGFILYFQGKMTFNF